MSICNTRYGYDTLLLTSTPHLLLVSGIGFLLASIWVCASKHLWYYGGGNTRVDRDKMGD
jgi:hypothetical protein